MSVNLVSSKHEKYMLRSFFHRDVFSSIDLVFIISFVPYDCGPYIHGIHVQFTVWNGHEFCICLYRLRNCWQRSDTVVGAKPQEL